MPQLIHKSSEVSTSVKIGKNVSIGPFCYIDGNIEIDDNTEIVSHCCIFGNVKLGK